MKVMCTLMHLPTFLSSVMAAPQSLSKSCTERFSIRKFHFLCIIIPYTIIELLKKFELNFAAFLQNRQISCELRICLRRD